MPSGPALLPSWYAQKCTLMRFMNCMIDITRCPLTLILTKQTHNSVKHEVIWKRQKGLFYMKYPNSGLGAFLDISGHVRWHLYSTVLVMLSRSLRITYPNYGFVRAGLNVLRRQKFRPRANKTYLHTRLSPSLSFNYPIVLSTWIFENERTQVISLHRHKLANLKAKGSVVPPSLYSFLHVILRLPQT